MNEEIDDAQQTDTGRDRNPKKLVSWRVTSETERQIQQLAVWLGSTKSEVMLYAVERLYQAEANKHGDNS